MTTSLNFELIRNHNDKLATIGGLAEQILYLDPGSAITRLRGFAEGATREIYTLECLPKLPERASFLELLKADAFRQVAEQSLQNIIHFLRYQGNTTAHGGEATVEQAIEALGYAHQLSDYLAVNYYGFTPDDQTKLKLPSRSEQSSISARALEKLLDDNRVKQEQLSRELEMERRARQYAEATAEKLQAARARSQKTASSLHWDENTTRKLLIDRQLAEAGWNVSDAEQVGLEIEVQHQPTQSGIGYADYVLWGDDGKPLAVVEAKRSRENMQKGREQARYYAEGLAKQFNCPEPIVFYTNGYEICIWDTKQYNAYRQIFGFYSKDSLMFLQFQHQHKEKNLELLNPDGVIAGRPYQIEAIKAVTNRFQNQRRRALIVQATGTGKTRVSIALVALLLKARWVKRVLFLCDRKELRRQADDAFKQFLPSEPRCVVGDTNQIDQSARIFVGTYPGMMNRFSQLDVGFFDLIIADESHRSIYNKYRDIFDYFDSLQVGLTATPVKFIARNTFDLFGCENGDPTFNFDLTDAIKHQPRYLNPFRVKEFTTEFLRDGIKYKDLTDTQREQLEEDLGDEEAQKTVIKGKDIGKKIFSESTDGQILENLMENGIRDATNSLVGKTIIFAQSQDHAEHLETMFVKLYPQYGTKVCKVIHNKVDRPEARIDEFKNPDNLFRIAISVDMMDTGIDVPEVVNLVFARPVKSWVKFWQMIGRGTRLCENLFGPGKHKEEFLIFDHYGNFKYFEEEYTEAEITVSRSLLQTVFEARLALIDAGTQKSSIPAYKLSVALVKADICDLPENAISVKRELRLVKLLQESCMLEEMTGDTRYILASKIAPLMGARLLQDPDASMFDRLIAQLQTALVLGSSELENLKAALLDAVLSLAVTIHEVRQQADEIAAVQTQDYWTTLTVNRLEQTRLQLRSIMKYKKRGGSIGLGTPSTSTFDDDAQIREHRVSLFPDDAQAYRQRLKDILNQMLDQSPVLQKIHHNEPVTEDELTSLTSMVLTQHPGVDPKVLNEFYGRTPRELNITLSQLVGLDAEQVNACFTEFLQQNQLTYQQTQYLNQLKTFISRNGRIELKDLYTTSPFQQISNGNGLEIFNEPQIDALIQVMQPFILPSQSASL